MQDIVLPPKYYLDHFLDLIQEIKKHHLAFLAINHHRFLENFSGLAENAKLLFVRMINRKGPLFDCNDFIYPEIENIPAGWEELRQKNFIRPLSEEDIDLYLARLKKDAICTHLKDIGLSFKKSAGRDELLAHLSLQKEFLAGFSEKNTHLIILNAPELQYILFLYFGNIQSKLILPTLRDLGIKKTNKKAKMGAKFKDKTEALSHFFYAGLKEQQKRTFKAFSVPEISEWPLPILLDSKLIREELLLDLSKKTEEPEQSLEILKLCEFFPASEKRARLLHQLGHLDECQRELERMMDQPYSDEELLFAEDFLQRKYHKKKLSLLTETLRNAERIFIDESFFRHPEFGVVEYFKDQGHEAHFSENFLFVELFWKFFSAELEGRAHSEFDHAPPELKEKTFYTLHAAEIEEKLNSLTAESLMPLFEDEIHLSFIRSAPLDGIRSMLRYMAQDYYARSSGYPDLLTIQNGRIIFYEIKAEGDSLKANQLIQMRQLEKAGFEVKVMQVFYRYNENQTYVVVDLETTGTASSYNRITEIGAVKIRGNVVIDTYQTLVNPRRPIPQMIQGLTGITNEMVKNAPPFEEIADQFLEFVKDSIFVAHNVSFDYGFLQIEYSRLEQNFVRPFICTKSGMKKHYPGLDSYGLKNLCAYFNISLNSHHRAMCDAVAATELLKIINQKRSITS